MLYGSFKYHLVNFNNFKDDIISYYVLYTIN